jgi:serine/threonine protein kinase/tetratricopeptide (TPR) repeat protein
MSCPLGHQWEDLFDDQLTLCDGKTHCPVCGIVLEGDPADATQEATTRETSATLSTPELPVPDLSSFNTVEWEFLSESNATIPSDAVMKPEASCSNKDVPTVVSSHKGPHQPGGGPSLPGYEILGELGRGGMGVVYLARQVGLNRLVAIKMVLAGGLAGAAQRRRFRLEAQAVARLHHPNIVQIYDVGEQDEQPYFTLEYVENGSLSDRIGKSVLAPREAARFIEMIAQAVHCAHERGIIHRDLKPGNILLTREGTPKITDFGLAKLVDDDTAHTRTGSVVGTPSYMAPEQALGQNKIIGPAADIYALGSILYETLTGRPPFRGDTPMHVLLRLSNEDPEPMGRIHPGVPRDLETICLKCLQKEPRKRYHTALALAEDLQRFLAHEPIRARPTRMWERSIKWIRRRPTKAALIICCIVGALAFSGLTAFQAAGRVRAERQRLDNLRAEIHDIVVRAQQAVKSQAWDGAAELLAHAESKVASEPQLGGVPSEALEDFDFVRQRLAAHQTLRAFLQQRDEALFHVTLSLGEGSRHELSAAREKARGALALAGISLRPGEECVVGDAFTVQEKEELREKGYELLLVLAEAVAQPLPGQTSDEQRRCATEALRILDYAPALGFQTKAYHLRRARYFEQTGQSAAAKAEATLAEQHPLRSALDHYLLGEELYRQGTPQQALIEFLECLREKDNFWARYFLSLCYIRMNQADLARDNLTTCLSQHGEIVWIYLMRGFALGQLADFKGAEKDFADALKLLDKQPNVDARYVLYNNRAIMRVGQKNFEGAVADLREAIALRPRQYQAYASLAQTIQMQKHVDEAIQEQSKAIQAAEALVRSQEVEPTTLALLYRARAHLEREHKDAPAALADLDRTIALASPGSLLLAQAQVERGQLLNLEGSLQESLTAFDAALAARPGYAAADRGRGEVLFRLRRYAESIAALTDYFKHKGEPKATVYQIRALARVRLGHPKAALEDYTLALNLDPENATLLTQRGQAFLACQREQHQSALQDFEKAIQCNPNNGPAYSGRARVRMELGQIGPALADAEKALELGPQSASLLYATATLYARAVARLDSDGASKKRSDLEKRGRYQDQAIGLIGQALNVLPEFERAAFWRDTVQRDSALSPVRHSRGFVHLRQQYASIENASKSPAVTPSMTFPPK